MGNYRDTEDYNQCFNKLFSYILYNVSTLINFKTISLYLDFSYMPHDLSSFQHQIKDDKMDVT